MTDRSLPARASRRQRRAPPPPLDRTLPRLVLTMSPSLRSVIHWRVLCADLAEQERLVAVVERILDALEVAA